MTLIHTAFFAEAKPIIEHFKLQFITKKPFKIYKNKDIILCITGWAKQTLHVKEVAQKYEISKAINIGTAGCKDKSIEIGELFCTNKKLSDIPFATLSCSKEPIDSPKNIDTTLVDMESIYFLEATKKIEERYIFKVVSDYLDINVPKKEFVWEIISNSIKKWEHYV